MGQRHHQPENPERAPKHPEKRGPGQVVAGKQRMPLPAGNHDENQGRADPHQGNQLSGWDVVREEFHKGILPRKTGHRENHQEYAAQVSVHDAPAD